MSLLQTKIRPLPLLAGLLALVALALLAGCGDSDQETAEATVSKAAFIRQADQICQQSDKAQEDKVAALGVKVKRTQEPMNDKELILQAGLPPLRQEASELAELPLPADSAEPEAIINGIEDALATAEKDPESLLQEPGPFAKVEQQARAYGLQTCGTA